MRFCLHNLLHPELALSKDNPELDTTTGHTCMGEFRA
jgi:hypothetical protein